jgi:hypothetical protein
MRAIQHRVGTFQVTRDSAPVATIHATDYLVRVARASGPGRYQVFEVVDDPTSSGSEDVLCGKSEPGKCWGSVIHHEDGRVELSPLSVTVPESLIRPSLA